MAPPATACSIPTPPPPGGGPREKERQEDRCPELGPNLFLGRILTLLLHFLSGWILPCLTGVPSKPQSCLRLWGEVSPSCTHAHTHTHTHAYTHTHTSRLQMYLPIQPLSEKASLSSLLKAPSSLSLQHHCPTWAGLSLCDPVMSLLPGWGLALQLPTFTSDLHRPPLSPPNGLFGARHLSHPRWVSAFPPDTH